MHQPPDILVNALPWLLLLTLAWAVWGIWITVTELVRWARNGRPLSRSWRAPEDGGTR